MRTNGANSCMVKTVIVWLILGYRYIISPYLGNCCRFTPSCSEYALVVIEKHGVMKGLWFTVLRLLKCHPWHKGGEDAVL